jgi:hypothetical protein
MRSRAFIMVALSVSFAAGLIVGGAKQNPSLPAVEPAQAADAAFRDGLYQARLDVQEGRKPHPAIGRWNAAEARASFLAGYRRGYRPSSETVWSRIEGPSVAELVAAGYRDGIQDGSRHRTAEQPFHPEQTANYREAGAVYLGTTVEPLEYKHFYREGYMNGYQQAFFMHPGLRGEKTVQ